MNELKKESISNMVHTREVNDHVQTQAKTHLMRKEELSTIVQNSFYEVSMRSAHPLPLNTEM